MTVQSEQHGKLEQVARTFSAASPELLESRPLLERRSWKFPVPLHLLPKLLHQMRDSHHVLHAKNEVLARYETHYYDTTERLCYRDHHRGRPRRHKIRFRSYLDRNVTSLEIKLRAANGMRNKIRLDRDFQDYAFDQDASEFLMNALQIQPTDLELSLMNRFRRINLLAVNTMERVTIDVGIEFFDNKNKTVRLPGVGIIEVKSAEPRFDTLSLRLLRALGCRPRSVSKYCVGSSILNPDLPANTFLPILKTLNKLRYS